jgi:hypothetical protein
MGKNVGQGTKRGSVLDARVQVQKQVQGVSLNKGWEGGRINGA